MRIPVSHLRSPKIDMVPLIDTFFLLLAFFVSSVLTMEVVRGLPVELPLAGKDSSLESQDRGIVTVGEGEMLQWEGEPITLQELYQRLLTHPQRETLQVAIRGDRHTPYHRVIEVLSVVKEARVRKVTLLTQPDKESF